MRRLQVGVRRGEGRWWQGEECRIVLVIALFRAHWMGLILQYGTISILSSHKWEASMPNSGRSHLPCFTSLKIQSIYLLFFTRTAVFVAICDGLGLCCHWINL
jgi:hypothetical protein